MSVATQDLATVVAPVVTPEQIEIVRRTIYPGASDDNLALHLHECKRRGLHPMDRLIFPSTRQGRYTPITSIDYFRTQAAASGEMAGSDDAAYEIDNDGSLNATVTVYRLTRGERYAYTATARTAEYRPDAGPSNNADRMWRRMPFFMIAKCAEALALRKAFPQQLGGLYVAEELGGEPGPESDAVVDTTTGEELPRSTAPTTPPPSGYRYIDAIHEDGDWLHVLFYDSTRQRPAERYKTKLAKVATKLRLAYSNKLPVALDITPNRQRGEPGYVNAVEIGERPVDLDAADAARDLTDDPPA